MEKKRNNNLDPLYSVSPEKMKKLLGPKTTSKPSASPSPRIAPMQSSSEARRQEKALADLMKKRQQEANRTGNWNNYGTN